MNRVSLSDISRPLVQGGGSAWSVLNTPAGREVIENADLGDALERLRAARWNVDAVTPDESLALLGAICLVGSGIYEGKGETGQEKSMREIIAVVFWSLLGLLVTAWGAGVVAGTVELGGAVSLLLGIAVLASAPRKQSGE